MAVAGEPEIEGESGQIARVRELETIRARAPGRQGLVDELAGAAELRVKESDRISAVVGNLQTLGVEAEELGPDAKGVR